MYRTLTTSLKATVVNEELHSEVSPAIIQSVSLNFKDRLIASKQKI